MAPLQFGLALNDVANDLLSIIFTYITKSNHSGYGRIHAFFIGAHVDDFALSLNDEEWGQNHSQVEKIAFSERSICNKSNAFATDVHIHQARRYVPSR